MRRESVSELTGIRRQVEDNLLELIHHHPARALVAAKLSTVGELLTLAHAADDGPHEQVGHIDGHRLRQRRELGGVRADLAGVATGFQWQDLETADFL